MRGYDVSYAQDGSNYDARARMKAEGWSIFGSLGEGWIFYRAKQKKEKGAK